MGYTNSSLISYTKISPNKTVNRTHSIDRITPHCFVGQVTAQRGCDVFFAPSRKASCNYVIGYDGQIGLCVEEKDRSWCSSNAANDHRAVTMEIASDTVDPYTITDAAYKAAVNLMEDICRRNGKNKLIWFADKTKSLNYQPKDGEMLITVHRWFAAKACPGNYIYNNLGKMTDEVNQRLNSTGNNSNAIPSSSTQQSFTSKQESTKQLYRVRKTWADSTSQIGAYSSLDNAKKVCKAGYYVFDSNGNVVYPIENYNTSSASSGTYTRQQFIKDVQSAIGAKMDGIAGNETLTKTITVSITKNSKHKVVKPIQKYLNALGYSCGNADGIAGVKFDSAVKAYQKANGCTVDGEITARKKTWQKLLGMI